MLLIIAFLWGFAEATLFFIVPDVFFTYLVLFDFGLASWSCLFALVGALIGGGLMYQWGRKNFEQVTGIVESLPGVSNRLVQREKANLKEKGVRAILLGPLKGVPYKIYAICSSSSGISFFQFLLISIPARLTRFVLSVLITELAFHRLLPTLSLMAQIAILSGFWLIFYTGYFLKMRNFSR
jgi:membrane protein YqaA with SNARE-associated domain